MILPRYGMGRLILACVIASLFFWVVRQALYGVTWAKAAAVALASLAVVLGVYVLLFAVAWTFAKLVFLARTEETASPFATEALPAQIITPEDVDG